MAWFDIFKSEHALSRTMLNWLELRRRHREVTYDVANTMYT